MRVQDIINNVRTDLGDEDIQRYSDTKLLVYLNEGLEDFVIATRSLKQEIYVELASGVANYTVEEFALFIERVEYMHKQVSVVSNDELDALDREWKFREGENVTAVTFNHKNKGEFRIYPFLRNIKSNIVQSNPFGILNDITIDDDILSIPTIEDVEADLSKYLVLFGVKKPNKVALDTTDEELELDTIYDAAMCAYIKYRCLRADSDDNNRAYANEELGRYSSYVSTAKSKFALSNQNAGKRVIQYRGFV